MGEFEKDLESFGRVWESMEEFWESLREFARVLGKFWRIRESLGESFNSGFPVLTNFQFKKFPI